jgi:hypothetical protein
MLSNKVWCHYVTLLLHSDKSTLIFCQYHKYANTKRPSRRKWNKKVIKLKMLSNKMWCHYVTSRNDNSILITIYIINMQSQKDFKEENKTKKLFFSENLAYKKMSRNDKSLKSILITIYIITTCKHKKTFLKKNWNFCLRRFQVTPSW